MTYLIIDTNVCLHFTPVDHYPWVNHIKDSEGITIVFTYPLIEELDKKKYSGKNHLKERAVKTIKMIAHRDTIKSQNGCKFLFYNEMISREYVESKGLDNADGDDRMIASIIKFIEGNHEKVFFVTNDLGPQLKSQKFNIQCIEPDSSHLLKNPEEYLEKSIKSLKYENETLKNLIPKLSLTFQKEQKLFKCKISRLVKTKEDFLSHMMIRVRQTHPRIKLKEEEEQEKSNQNDFEKNEQNPAKSIQKMLENIRFPHYRSEIPPRLVFPFPNHRHPSAALGVFFNTKRKVQHDTKYPTMHNFVYKTDFHFVPFCQTPYKDQKTLTKN